MASCAETVDFRVAPDRLAKLNADFLQHRDITSTQTEPEVGEREKRSKEEWPTTAQALSGRLRSAAPFLSKVGVRIDFKHSGTRKIHISRGTEIGRTKPSVPSTSSTSALKPKVDNGIAWHPARTKLNESDDRTDAECGSPAGREPSTPRTRLIGVVKVSPCRLKGNSASSSTG